MRFPISGKARGKPMTRRGPLAVVLTLVLLVAVSMVQVANSARPTCLVSNERTGVGSRSLQEGINAAAVDDTLVVKGTCVGNSTVDRDLTLKGVSNKQFGTATLDGGGSGSVLTIGAATVTVETLLIRNGLTGGGGGIHNSGTATLINATVNGNTATVGGGILNDGALMLTNSTVSGNTATQSGGGIYNNGTLTLANSTVYANSATIAGGGMLNLGSATFIASTVSFNTAGFFGGGIWNFGTLTLTDSVFTINAAGIDGGGIYSPAGGVTLNGTNAFVNNSPNGCVGC